MSIIGVCVLILFGLVFFAFLVGSGASGGGGNDISNIAELLETDQLTTVLDSMTDQVFTAVAIGQQKGRRQAEILAEGLPGIVGTPLEEPTTRLGTRKIDQAKLAKFRETWLAGQM